MSTARPSRLSLHYIVRPHCCRWSQNSIFTAESASDFNLYFIIRLCPLSLLTSRWLRQDELEPCQTSSQWTKQEAVLTQSLQPQTSNCVSWCFRATRQTTTELTPNQHTSPVTRGQAWRDNEPHITSPHVCHDTFQPREEAFIQMYTAVHWRLPNQLRSRGRWAEIKTKN